MKILIASITLLLTLLTAQVVQADTPKTSWYLVATMQGLNADGKEDLFAFKLASFELDIVKNCKDKNQKAAIRKAQSPLDVVKAISDIK